MGIYELAEGPLLWMAFTIPIGTVLIRFGIFSFCTIKRVSGIVDKDSRKQIISVFMRWAIPFYKAVFKKPLYTLSRYLFHACLIAVPIWYSGHIALWEESHFQWYWTAMPDALVDRLTLVIIGFAIYFLGRRLILWLKYKDASILDFALIALAVFPFITGYILVDGTLDGISVFRNHMMLFHILSGEAMLVAVAFLFCSMRFHSARCVGCAVCAFSCPTGALEYSDNNEMRRFNYLHYRCICCGDCVATCPENAAALRHKLSFRPLFQVTPRIQKEVELERCETCGTAFAPSPQLSQLQEMVADRDMSLEAWKACTRCKKRTTGRPEFVPMICLPRAKRDKVVGDK